MYSSFRTANHQLNEDASLGILKHLNKEELQQLLDDDARLMTLINDDSQIKQFEGEKESLLAQNRSTAEFNLSLEPRLNSAKQQLASTYEQAVQVQKAYEETKQKLDFQLAQQDLDTILALMQTEAAKSEEQSEEMAERLLEGKFSDDVESFLDDFITRKTVVYSRRVKAEKLQEIIRGGGPSTNAAPATASTRPTPVSSQPPYPQAQASWGSHPTRHPYPSQPMAMPNPSSYL